MTEFADVARESMGIKRVVILQSGVREPVILFYRVLPYLNQMVCWFVVVIVILFFTGNGVWKWDP